MDSYSHSSGKIVVAEITLKKLQQNHLLHLVFCLQKLQQRPFHERSWDVLMSYRAHAILEAAITYMGENSTRKEIAERQ